LKHISTGIELLISIIDIVLSLQKDTNDTIQKLN